MDDGNDPPSWTRTWISVLDLISSQSKKQIRGMDTVMVSDDDCARRALAHARSIRGRYPDIVWEGWDASLIESKTKRVKRKKKSKAALKGSGMRKGKFKAALKRSGRPLCEAEALELGLWSAAMPEGKCSEKIYLIAKTVAALTLRGMVCFDFPNWQKLLSPKLYESVHDSVFSSIAKFILTVFDLEDFERIFNLEMLIDSYTKFCHSLRELEPDRGALIAIAEETIKVREDPILREHDVGEILELHTILSRYEDYGRCEVQMLRWEYEIYPITVDGIELHLMELALEEMRKYVPLKGHHKMQLMLEFVRHTKSHILGALSLEAMKDVKFMELFEYVTKLAEDKQVEDFGGFECLKLYMEDTEPRAFAIKLLDAFVGAMHDGLAILKEFKFLAVRMFHVAALAPLGSDGFGSFDREVIDVVEVAYIERRMQGHRFINIEHFLFSLSLSRVAKPVQRILDGKGLKRNIGKHSKVEVSSWKIYDLSVKAASENGEHMVRLEHFALAVIAWKLQNDPPSKMAMDAETSQANDDVIGNAELLEALKNGSEPVKKSWKCDGLVRLPEGCYKEKYKEVMCYKLDAAVELLKDFDKGLNLPAIRLEI